MCQVTIENFDRLLPKIQDEINESCFLAIDTEFSSLETFSSSTRIKSIQQFYNKRSTLVKDLTIFQFGLAIFSFDINQGKYFAKIYNFYLSPTSIYPIDVKFEIRSSSIKFLTEFKFDFNKCFYEGISFLNDKQEKILIDAIQVRDFL